MNSDASRHIRSRLVLMFLGVTLSSDGAIEKKTKIRNRYTHNIYGDCNSTTSIRVQPFNFWFPLEVCAFMYVHPMNFQSME